MIDRETANELFYYDETSKSCLRRKKDWLSGVHYKIVKAKAKSEVGFLRPDGYWSYFNGKKEIKIHRIIMIMFGHDIDGLDVDHINGDRGDNRIQNLRVVNRIANTQNQKIKKTNTSGKTGVRLKTNPDRWVARWTFNGKQKELGFKVSCFGEKAFDLACEHRDLMIFFMNILGQNYTMRHGQ